MHVAKTFVKENCNNPFIMSIFVYYKRCFGDALKPKPRVDLK
jgi:hypothetical protein